MSACVVALLGAESTGKSRLTTALCQRLRDKGYRAVVVSEYLREWCDKEGRTPTKAEQSAIALEQTRRIQEATANADIVIADTTALMTAVYSDYLFQDQSFYASTLLSHSAYALTLLMGLDVPWTADGLQRDGAHVREPIDAMLRTALAGANLPFQTIYGLGEARVESALNRVLQTLGIKPKSQAVWKHFCECCGDGQCERQLLCLTT